MKAIWGIRLAVISAISVVSCANASQVYHGEISKNVDGDTVWVEANKERLKVRMISIDTPETHLVGQGGVQNQGHWGTDAADYLANLVPLHTEVDLVSFGKDHYGRVLGRVIKKKEDINLTMVKSGWAIPYIICEKGNCDKGTGFFKEHNVDEYLKACDVAVDKGLGVFDPEDELKEMPFEFRLRIQGRKPDKYVGDYVTKELHKPADYHKVDVCNRIFFMTLKDAKAAGFTPIFNENEL